MKEYKYTINGNQYQVAIEEAGETTAKAIVNGTEYIVEWEKPKEEKPVVKVKPAAAPKPATAAPAAAPAAAPVSGNAIKTPLPGVIIDVKVSVGDTVKKGDTVVVLEAMKMDTPVNATSDGTVTKIYVAAGQSVQEGEPLVALS